MPLKVIFPFLQKIGKSLMLPVAVLPIAGLLLGIGSANFTWLPMIMSKGMAQAGSSIFSNLPIIFAVGAALGLAANDGVAALSAVVGYCVLLASLGVFAPLMGAETKLIMGIQSIDTGVFGGIWIGIVAAFLFNHFYTIQLPSYLGFFSGKRSVPILTAFSAIVSGFVLSILWPPIGGVINGFSHWAANENPAVAFSVYGFFERVLIPFGLHHIWNVPFFFQSGQYLDPATGQTMTGEIARFIAGDPTAGNLAGGYLFKMWGLPAAAIAIWLRTKPENRSTVGGVMMSAALTSFLTGITEPIEFAFMFVAPLLYGVHAVLCSAAFFLCITLGIKHGMTFSHGLIDFLILFPKSSHANWFFVIGPIWAAIYFGMFWGLIGFFDFKTPGREVQDEVANTNIPEASSLAASVLVALGGAGNITNLDACVTRLRVSVRDAGVVQVERLKALGASGVLQVAGGVQAIFGTQSENLKTQIDGLMKVSLGVRLSISQNSAAATPRTESKVLDGEFVNLLGGASNMRTIEQLNPTRWRVQLSDPSKARLSEIEGRNDMGLLTISDSTYHLVVR